MKDIFKKISYQMTNAVAYSFEVDDIIATDFGVDYVPKHLPCQSYPSLFIKTSIISFL